MNKKPQTPNSVRHYRILAGFKKAGEFAERIGIDPSRLSKIENGHYLPERTLIKISEELNVSIAELTSPHPHAISQSSLTTDMPTSPHLLSLSSSLMNEAAQAIETKNISELRKSALRLVEQLDAPINSQLRSFCAELLAVVGQHMPTAMSAYSEYIPKWFLIAARQAEPQDDLDIQVATLWQKAFNRVTEDRRLHMFGALSFAAPGSALEEKVLQEARRYASYSSNNSPPPTRAEVENKLLELLDSGKLRHDQIALLICLSADDTPFKKQLLTTWQKALDRAASDDRPRIDGRGGSYNSTPIYDIGTLICTTLPQNDETRRIFIAKWCELYQKAPSVRMDLALFHLPNPHHTYTTPIGGDFDQAIAKAWRKKHDELEKTDPDAAIEAARYIARQSPINSYLRLEAQSKTNGAPPPSMNFLKERLKEMRLTHKM